MENKIMVPRDHYKRLELLGVIHILKKNNIKVPMEYFDKPEPIREVIKFLRDHKGYTFDKIGRILDKTPGAVVSTYMGKKQ